MSNEVGPKYINPNKKYGLVLPNKTQQPVAKPQKVVKLAAFNDEDEENLDEEETTTKYKVNTNETRLKKQTQINIEKALAEDPTVFDYDSVYEKLEEEKQKSNPNLNNKSKEPKYIAGLMKAAALRQIEYERRQDRKIQKEREEEGNMFSDKESFVTDAYRKRMEERQRLEEEERNQDQIEALLDVRKAKDLSGIHNTLLKMRTGEFKFEEEGEKEKRLERERKEKEEIERKLEEEKRFAQKSKDAAEKAKHKSYRVRKEEVEEESSDEDVNEKKQENDAQLDQDEKIIDEEQEKEEGEEEPKNKKIKTETDENKHNIEIIKEDDKTELKSIIKKIETKEERWKRLFTKRTVDKVFNNELSNYFNRRNDLLSMKLYIERE